MDVGDRWGADRYVYFPLAGKPGAVGRPQFSVFGASRARVGTAAAFGARLKLNQTVLKGSAPAHSITVDANNRVNGQTYDANGNLTSGASSTLTFDVDNHVATATGLSSEWYSYSAADGKRVTKRKQVGSAYQEELYLYGAGTGRLATYLWNGNTWAVKSIDLRFAGHAIYQGGD